MIECFSLYFELEMRVKADERWMSEKHFPFDFVIS